MSEAAFALEAELCVAFQVLEQGVGFVDELFF